MSIFKCKMCGGTIEFESGSTVGECEHCGTKQTLPKLDDACKVNLYDRANHFRRNNDYDKATGIYEQILNEDSTDAEAYWSLVLCRYGIEYVEDPATHKRVPTVNRTQFTSIFDDDNYKSALQYADTLQRTIYEQEANAINEIQKGILSISQKEDPFDVFICYKETDANGRRTPDSVLANDLYHQLTQEGFKIFFSRITLEDKLGTAYEPYIFAALNSAKVMVVLGTKPEYFNAVWVKNEWSRFLGLVKRSNGKKILIPAYKDMDPYDLPEEFSHLQAQDMSKLGFMQDLIRGIKKIAVADESKVMVKEKVFTGSAANVAPLLKRAFMFLEDEEWDRADDFCEQVLNQEPENAQAYLGKLLAELHVRRQEDLANCSQPFDSSNNYKKVIRFGDISFISPLKSYIDHINERNENARLIGIYNNAVLTMNSANTESAFKTAAEAFNSISEFKDSIILAKQCFEKAEECQKEEEKRRRAKEERRRAEEERRRAEEERRITEEKKVKRIAEAIKAGKITDDSPMNKEKLLVSKARIESLSTLRDGFDALLTQKIQLQKEQTAVTSHKSQLSEELSSLLSQEASLTSRRSELGIFARKEKKQIDEILTTIYLKKRDIDSCLSTLDDKNNDITNRIRKNTEQLCGFNSIEEIDKEITKENENASKLEEQIEVLQANGDYSYSYEEAFKIYLSEPEMTRAVNALLYPTVNRNSVVFGRYVQKKNGIPEPIEWRVLTRENSRLLVISEYALDCQPYNYNKEIEKVTWESCSLRKWLNEIFLNEAFSEEERVMIPKVMVNADRNPEYITTPGNNTTDKVFLLSIMEVEKYFYSEDVRQCNGTAYCNNNLACGWWLRSPGILANFACCVDRSGNVYSHGYSVNVNYIGVRPALYINL